MADNPKKHNRVQVERYLVFWASVHRSSAGSSADGRHSSKPESSSPLSEGGERWIDDPDNRHASSLLMPIFQQMKVEKDVYWFFAGWVAGWITDPMMDEPDHGALRRWRAGETELDRKAAQTFEQMKSWVADRLYDIHPELHIYINLPPKDEEPVGPAVGARNGTSYKRADTLEKKRWQTEDSYRKIALGVEKLIEEGMGVEEAIEHYRREKDMSRWRVDEARRFAKAEMEQSA